MSDSGKINFSQPKIQADKATAKPANTPNPEIANPKENSIAKQVQIENRSVFKNPSISQQELSHDPQEKLNAQQNTAKLNNKEIKDKTFNQKANSQTEAGLKVDYQIQSQKPLVAAQLQNPSKPNIKPKNKKNPPDARYTSQGKAINPRKVKPSIPGRLQLFFDIGKNPAERLNEALNIMQIDSQANNLKDKVISELSFAQIFGLDTELLSKDLATIISTFTQAAEILEDNPALKEVFAALLAQLEGVKTNDQVLLALLQMYSPLPFPYLIDPIDEEFNEDEDELLGKKYKKKNQREGDEEEEDIEYDSIVSMSLTTLNFNKMHLLIKYSTEANKLRLNVIGDPIATELLIPIETNIEEALGNDLTDITQTLKTWHDNVLRITESRRLQVKATGTLNPIIIKACNSILETVNHSDIDLSADDVIASDYRLL